MIVVRLVGFLALITIGVSIIVWLVTRNERWLRFATQVLKLTLVGAIIVVLLYVFERTL